MKKIALALTLLLPTTPAFAQFGGLDRLAKGAEKVKKITDINISVEDERKIGQNVSDQLVEKFGVYQDPAVNKYVTLVGSVLAQAGTRPELSWQFVVLDSEGVNAFAAPGGFVHVTKGLLGLMKTEAELAGVLAHEVIHVTEKHTIKAIQKSNAVSVGTDEVGSSGGLAGSLISKMGDAAYKIVFENEFSRGDEGESDEKGVQLANRVGYAPTGLRDALTKLSERMAGKTEKSGLFASHPVIKDRIAKIDQTIKGKKLAATATVAARYTSTITFDALPIDSVPQVTAGAKGLSGGEEKKESEAKPAEKPSGGGLGGALSKLTGSGKQAQQTQTVAAGGARGVNPDRDAVGGPNKNRVKVTLTAAEIDAFKKGIA